MARLVAVAKTGDLAPGQCTVVQVDDREIALYRVGDNFYATDNVCLHRGGPLGEGELSDRIVTCPWHGWQYDVSTGTCVHDPNLKVATFPVVVDGDDIKLSV